MSLGFGLMHVVATESDIIEKLYMPKRSFKNMSDSMIKKKKKSKVTCLLESLALRQKDL